MATSAVPRATRQVRYRPGRSPAAFPAPPGFWPVAPRLVNPHAKNWLPEPAPERPYLERLRRVKQDDSGGCGFACVAIVTEEFYWEVCLRAVIARITTVRAYEAGTSIHQVARLLRAKGVKCGLRYDLLEWEDLPELSIVGVHVSTPHWVVAVRDGAGFRVFDPGHNNDDPFRRDVGRINLLGEAIEILAAGGDSPMAYRVPR